MPPTSRPNKTNLEFKSETTGQAWHYEGGPKTQVLSQQVASRASSNCSIMLMKMKLMRWKNVSSVHS